MSFFSIKSSVNPFDEDIEIPNDEDGWMVADYKDLWVEIFITKIAFNWILLLKISNLLYKFVG